MLGLGGEGWLCTYRDMAEASVKGTVLAGRIPTHLIL